MHAITGNVRSIPSSLRTLHSASTLYAGTHCNDGRPIAESSRYQEAVRRGIPIVHTPIAPMVKENHSLWVDQYAPSSLSNVIGHKESIATMNAWLRDWSTARPQKGLLLSGPPGIGKTTCAHLVAKEAGYVVAEYNASDTRSISMLKGLFGLGMKRLRKELIIMDEVDGFTAQDRGGVGELADLIRKSNVPIICIANHLVPKLKPLENACLSIKFSRPVKSTIATALLGICKKENVTMSKAELETLCEQNGNDVRMMLNHLQFITSREGCGDAPVSPLKDATLRLDLFSSTQKLMSNRRLTLSEADDLVYVDYGMIPLMVQEAYLSASRTLEEAVSGSEQVSFGDIMSTQQWKTQDWSLLPHVVHSAVAASRKVTGPCPFQIFPKLLGKNATRGKHRRQLEDVARIRRLSMATFRIEEAELMQQILLTPLRECKGNASDKAVIQGVTGRMDAIGVSRDQLMENVCESVWHAVDVPSKVKTAFTREYNKGHVRVIKEEEEEEYSELDV